MTYGGTPPTITPSYSGFVNGDTAASLTTPPTCSTTATSHSPAGSYPSTCSGAVDSNYTISYVSGTVTDSAAPLAITASNGVDDLRRHAAHHHAQLQRLCERGHGGQPDHAAHLLHHRHLAQPGGLLPFDLHGSGG